MSFQDGKLYRVTELTNTHPHWQGVQDAINRNRKSSSLPYIIEELYSVTWIKKPFPWSWTKEFKPNRRFFFHGTSRQSIQKILDEGFKTSYTRNGKMLGDGVYITYHSNKGKNYAPEDYIISTMIYAPRTYVVHPNQTINQNAINTLSKRYDAIEVRTGSIVGSWTMQNHEICVYNPKRVVPRFIIKLR
ncbi:MAG: hypothetical protein GXO60_10195 [Epsilonproteobacteria bacterium]|nr:hypothetical protein [Campylobacterota bacterium]